MERVYLNAKCRRFHFYLIKWPTRFVNSLSLLRLNSTNQAFHHFAAIFLFYFTFLGV